MYHWMDATGWFWMSFIMIFWIVLLGAAVISRSVSRTATAAASPGAARTEWRRRTG
jgi:hypothetical protein